MQDPLRPLTVVAARTGFQSHHNEVILGVCDAGCSDIDLMLIDAAGRMIAQDILEDDVPILTPEITASGTYGLRVTMPACSVDPCGYAIAIFTQD
jgi:hypothetical protein